MAELKANPFAGYIFTDEEMVRASTFHMENRMYLQTVMSDAACEKIALEPAQHSLLSYIQKEAYLRGQIDIINYLLDAQVSPTRVRPNAETEGQRIVGVNWMDWAASGGSSNSSNNKP